MKLCAWCLKTSKSGSYDDPDTVRDVPFGWEKGSQRDPHRETIALCGLCVEAFQSDLALFHARYKDERTVRRDDDDS